MKNKKAHIITIASLKGGVGKTTVTQNLGYNISLKGKKVLLIDFDSQGDLTKGLNIKKPDDEEYTIADLMYFEMFENGTALKDYSKYINTYSENLHFITCNIEMADIETNLGNTNIMNSDATLKRILKPILDKYDYILIDSGRSMGNLLKNLLCVSNSVIIPIEPSLYSVKGLQELLKQISRSNRSYDNGIECKGIVINMFDSRTNIDKHVKNEVSNELPNIIFNTTIPRAVAVKYSTFDGKSITEYDTKNKVSEAFISLTDELLERLEG